MQSEKLNKDTSKASSTILFIVSLLPFFILLMPLTIHAQSVTDQKIDSLFKGFPSSDKPVPFLIEALKDSDSSVRVWAAKILGDQWDWRLGDKTEAVPALIAALRDPDSRVRAAAVRALEEIGDTAAAPALIAALKDPDSRVRAAVVRALETIGDKRGDETAVPALTAALQDPDSSVRAAAAQALVKIGDKTAVPALIAALRDPDSRVPTAAVRALEEIGDTSAVPALIAVLRGPDIGVRDKAALALGKLGDKTAVPALIAALKDHNIMVLGTAAIALGMLGDSTAVPALVAAMKDPDSSLRGSTLRSAAAWALGEVGDKSAVPSLIEALKDAKGWVRAVAASALGRLRDTAAVPALIEALKDPDSMVLGTAAGALGILGDRRAVPALIEAIKDPDSSLRAGAAQALGQLGDRTAVPLLIVALKDPDSRVRATAAAALGQLGDRTGVPTLIAALKGPDKVLSRRIAWVLGEVGDKSAVLPLIEALKEKDILKDKDIDSWVRAGAAQALGQLGDRTAVPPLIEALKDDDRWVRAAAAGALLNMGEVGEVYKAFVARPEIPLFNIIKKGERFDDNGLKQLTGSRNSFQKSAGYYVLALRSKVQEEADSEKQLQYSQKAFENIDPQAYSGLAILSLWLKAEAEIFLAKPHDASKTIKTAEIHLARLSPIERKTYGELFEEYTLFLKGEVYARLGEDKTAIGNYEAARERLQTSGRIRRILFGSDEREAEKLESLIKKRLGTFGAKYYAEIREEGIRIGEKYKPVTELEMEIDEGAYAQQIIQVGGKGNYEEAQRLAEELSMRRTAYLNRKLNIKLADTEKQKSIDEYKIKQRDIDALEEKKWSLATKEGGRATGARQERGSSEIEKLESEIRVKQRELNNYLVTLKRIHPDLAVLLGAKPIELKSAQEKLSPHTALLQYLILPEKLLTFIIKPTDIDIHEESIKREDLKVKVEQYKALLHKIDKSIEKSGRLPEDGTLKELDKIYSDLYHILIKPVEGKLRGITTLGISPNGYLHYIPFGALWAEEGGKKVYLIDKYKSIFYINSTSLFWIASDRRGKSDIKETKLVAYINPDESLKYAKDEEKDLETIFKKRDIYYGKEAKKEKLGTIVLSDTVLHFSTHGRLNSQNSTQSYLLMADNKHLTVQEIWGLPLKGNVVTTLSACETGVGQILSGDDIVSLENAFIYAGSPSVVSTLWKVDEKATVEIVKAFYKNLVVNKMDKAEALTQAQREVRKAYPYYKDPYFWAGFTLRGTYQ